MSKIESRSSRRRKEKAAKKQGSDSSAIPSTNLHFTPKAPYFSLPLLWQSAKSAFRALPSLAAIAIPIWIIWKILYFLILLKANSDPDNLGLEATLTHILLTINLIFSFAIGVWLPIIFFQRIMLNIPIKKAIFRLPRLTMLLPTIKLIIMLIIFAISTMLSFYFLNQFTINFPIEGKSLISFIYLLPIIGIFSLISFFTPLLPHIALNDKKTTFRRLRAFNRHFFKDTQIGGFLYLFICTSIIYICNLISAPFYITNPIYLYLIGWLFFYAAHIYNSSLPTSRR